jgi:hypothetical protein
MQSASFTGLNPSCWY